MSDHNDLTLASYEAAAEKYIERTRQAAPAVVAFLDRLAALVGSGLLLELGSGPGRDADYLTQLGIDVVRTDATAAFVDRLRAAGHGARRLDVRTGALGGPYDAIMANAVLLHLSRPQFQDVLRRARASVSDSGVMAFTIKEGDGDGWTDVKLEVPRHWRAPAVRAALHDADWEPISLDHVPGHGEDWLFALARAGRPDDPPR